jgi:hypothetical protein
VGKARHLNCSLSGEGRERGRYARKESKSGGYYAILESLKELGRQRRGISVQRMRYQRKYRLPEKIY